MNQLVNVCGLIEDLVGAVALIVCVFSFRRLLAIRFFMEARIETRMQQLADFKKTR